MWRKILCPEVLFLLGTLQALSPYILWYVQGPNDVYIYKISYLPSFIWIVGYLFFLLGTRFFKYKRYNITPTIISITFNNLNRITFVVSALIVIQIIGIIQSYGFLPILEFFSGNVNINDVIAKSIETGLGQLGAFFVSLFFLNGLLLSIVIKAVESNKKLPWFFVFNLLVAIFGTLITGKRQGLFILLFFLFSDSIRFLLSYLMTAL
jgi:hypothetical protein